MIVFLDRQHVGKPHRLQDMGAWGDLDKDGKADVVEQEAYLTALYGLYAEVALRERGLDVVVLSDGRYADRHRRVNEYSRQSALPCVYVALHLNAHKGQADYGSVFYDHRSPEAMGHTLSVDVANALRKHTRPRELGQIKVIKARPTDWTKRAYGTIAGLGSRVAAVCYEPAFISTRKHAPLFEAEGLQRLGLALADGIATWSAPMRRRAA